MYPFRDGSFAVRNAWYVLAWGSEVTRQPLERWLLGEPVALYRKLDGGIAAIAGNCPHRHYPLAEGCLEGDSLRCPYHGLRFAADGQCDDIPSQSHVPRAYRARSYPVVQQWEWVWVWAGDPERADPSLLPADEEIRLNEEGFVYRPFYFHEIKARYQLLNDNLLDLTHLAFLHASTIGQRENSTTPDVREQTGRRLSSRREMKDVALAPASRLRHQGKVDRVSAMDFFAPGLHAGIDETRVASSDPERGGELLAAGRVYHAVTPATRDTTYYFFANGARSEEELDRKFELLKEPIAEDIHASEEIERILSRMEGPPRELLLKADAQAVQGRRLLQEMMDREQTAGTAAGGAAPEPARTG
ncbi:iron-sulfur protein [Altererythrobacter sp. B11]|uniref:aromatic ring-hydroxylating dioxygenase subunit alpha n=1 Tax=Altererythrobacter sp. B11 TaxID=2060312 RepID=UPI000DC6D54D|nr:aromatic ring-hydroxylating dioxygenase subunit alpha [Altererythrobacter sp. B11]BBC71137.1 iron-sulfur protein [Altererythrobacter sp. B11]